MKKKVFSKSMSWILSVVMMLGMTVVFGSVNVFAAQFIYPLKKGSFSITQAYGNDGHTGTDFGVPLQTPVYASCAGTVKVGDLGCLGSHIGGWPACSKGTSCAAYTTSTYDMRTYGNYIDIDHGNGWKTRYAHLTTGMMQVSTGDYVQQGQLIGYSGSSGSSTGPHLHFELIYKSSVGNNDPVTYCSGYPDNDPEPDVYEYMPLGEKYYLKNNGTGTYMSVDYGVDKQLQNISVYQFTGDAGQQYEIIGSDTDKSYFLRPVLCQSSGRVVNVNGESTSAGANIMLYNYTGHSTQQWKFRPVSGGYAICSTNNPNCCLAESGTNVQMASYTGTSNQIWTLEPVEHHHNYTEYVYNWSAHPHYKCYRCSCGEVMENRNEPTFVDTCEECIDSITPKGHVMSESEAAGQTIPDGDYYILSGIASDYYIDIPGDDFDTTNGANIAMWTWGSTIPDSRGFDCFHFEYLNNGFYKITQINTNMCLDVYGASLNRGANVQMWNYDGNNAQQWSIERTDHGYQLRPRCNAYYLDVYGGYHEPGTNVRCWEGNDSKAQSFAFIPRELSERPIADGVYVIRPYISNQHFLDVSGIFDEFQSGSNVQLWRSADSDTEEKFEITYIDDGWYSIIERTSGLALEVADPETNFLNASKNVQIGNYIGAKNQLWKIKKNSDGSFFFINKLSGYYLDFESGRLNNGTNVKQYTYNGSNAQRWTFEVDYDITSVAKGSFNGHTYEYYNLPTTWNQAYKFCEKKGGHLVTVTSKEENDFLIGLLENQPTDVWTGGRTFDAQTWFWITCEPFDFQNWNENQPDYYNNEEDSLEIYVVNGPIGTWNDLPQGNNTYCGFICEYENIDATKYTPVYKENYNGHEYWFFEDAVDWQTAKKICEGKGGYLAIPNGADENAFILSGVQKTSKEEAWLGITDIAQEGVWKNVKGNSISYSNWETDEPSGYLGIEDYVEMYPSGKWNDLRGFGASYRSVGFVCEFDSLCVLGHQYVDKYVAATDSENAHIIHKCSVCGYEWIESKTVSFETNGGTPVDSIDLLDQSVYGTLPVPTKDGYTFKGWSLTPVDTNSSVFTHDTAIYFKVPESWGNVQTVFCHLWSTEREDPIYKWQSEQEICENMGNGLYKYIISSGTDANGVIFSAIEGYQTYDIALGTACENDVLYCVHQLSSYPYIYEGAWTVNKPFKSIPSSWYDGEDLVNGMIDPETLKIDGYRFVNADTEIKQTGDHTLYAIWEIKHYTISYNMNGGNGTISKQTKTHGKDLTLSATVPTRTDYIFVGWSTDKNTASATYQPGDKYTSNSNATLYAVWSANHHYSTKVIAPTCTEKGYTLHTCSNCSDSYKDTYTNALGHDYKLTSQKAAGCTTNGQKVYTCTRCSDTKTDTIKATGHSYTEKIVAPTCTEKGYTLHTCTVCGDSYKNTYTNALGHDYEEKIVAPTAASQGYTLYTCKRCGYSYKDHYTECLFANHTTLDTTSIEIGGSIHINASAEGGTAPYKFTVKFKKDSSQYWTLVQENSGNKAVSFKPESIGVYAVSVTASDSNGKTETKTFEVTVNKKAAPLSIEAHVAETLVLGDTLTITAKGSGGTGGYTYGVYYKKTTSETWSTVQPLTGTSTVITIKPASAVKYDVCVKVRDTSRTIEKQYFTVTVIKKDVPLTNESTVSKTSVPLGESVTITAKAAGGTAPYTYAVYYKKASSDKWTTAQSYKANAAVSIKPGSAVKYDICVKVKDAKGIVAKRYFTVNVTKELVNNSTLSATTVRKGSSITVTAKASGGTGKYTYGIYYKKSTSENWTTAQSYGTNTTVKIKPAAAVKYNICVKVKDSSGKIAKKYIDFTCTK